MPSCVLLGETGNCQGLNGLIKFIYFEEFKDVIVLDICVIYLVVMVSLY